MHPAGAASPLAQSLPAGQISHPFVSGAAASVCPLLLQRAHIRQMPVRRLCIMHIKEGGMAMCVCVPAHLIRHTQHPDGGIKVSFFF